MFTYAELFDIRNMAAEKFAEAIATYRVLEDSFGDVDCSTQVYGEQMFKAKNIMEKADKIMEDIA